MNQDKTRRRTFLGAMAGMPAIPILCAGAGAEAADATSGTARDVIQELGVRPFVNAAGTFTALTGSLMRPEVVAAMQVASRQYVKLEELQAAVGKRVAELLHCESALVTAGCASALSLATAACVAGKDAARIRRLPDTTGMKNEVIVQRTHRVGYDHAIRNAGVKLVEVETREQMEAALGDKTAMMFFLNLADPKGKIHHEEFVRIARSRGIPTLIDAAADVPPVENLWRFTKLGFDLVAFSGGKGLRGPQSSGLLLGRKDLIDAAQHNNCPNGDTLCRTNKVNKEEIVGMLVALETYLKEDHAAVWKEWEGRCHRITEALKEFPDVRTQIVVPQIANAVPHLHIRWDSRARRVTPAEMVRKLREGKPSIELPPGGARTQLVIGVWMMQPGDDAIVGRRIREILAGA
jgi:D-glucosaminate-6-phosphate ammonia-lyase